MTFRRTDPDQNFNLLRMESAEGQWEIGLTGMMFGVRVRAGRCGNGWCTFDYCSGPDVAWQHVVLHMVVKALEPYPETVTERELQDAFPRQQRKPMSDDGPCWDALVRLAYAIPAAP